MNVAVVGAGAVGATAAHDLVTAGATVDVFERGPAIDGATPRAAGVVYDAFAEDVDAGVADRATERFRSFSGTGGFEFVECPYVWLARAGDDRRATAIREGVERMRANGREVEVLDPAAVAERFPRLHAGDVAVAAVTGNAGHCDTGAYAETILNRAEAAGARLHFDRPATVAVDPPRVAGPPGRDRREYDAVLVAAGARSKRLLADAGVAIPLKPYRVQALTAGLGGVGGSTHTDDPDEPDGSSETGTRTAYDGPMVYDATAGFYCRPHRDGLLAGDGTEEREVDPDAYDRDGDREFREATAGGVAHRLDLDGIPDVRRAWAGVCTATPDRNPLLGAVDGGLYVATGFQGHGFMRSPALGEAIAEAILDGERAPIEPFDPGRFDGDEEFEVVEGMVLDED